MYGRFEVCIRDFAASRPEEIMSIEKFTTATAASKIAEQNNSLYTRQKEALSASALTDKILYAAWPSDADAPHLHAATPVMRDGGHATIDYPTLRVAKENFIALVNFIRSDAAFTCDFLLDLTAIDLLHSPRETDAIENQGKRFRMIYLFRSTKPERRSAALRIEVPVGENEDVPSLVGIWAGANWPEREVFDLFGIHFSGHPDLRRILMPDNYRGHPLRKDFPVKGIGEDYLIEDLLYKRRNVD